jgi:Fe-S cluster biogenesis protein NfuA
LVHGLHPYDVERRVSDALDSVRPYLGSHGGDVSLLGVDTGVVRLQFQGSCKSCPSSSVTLELAVEDAVCAAAPEISSIEVVAAEKDTSSGVIPAESLLAHVHANGHRTAWQPVPELAQLADGRSAASALRVSQRWCAAWAEESMRTATDAPAAPPARGRRNCTPRFCGVSCNGGFDAVHAGAGVGGDSHLEPLPMLVRDGVLSMAIPEEVA